MALKNKRKPSGKKWGVVDNGEIIFIAATRAEAEGYAGTGEKVRRLSEGEKNIFTDPFGNPGDFLM